MKTLNSIAISLVAATSLMAACSGRAASVPAGAQAVENDLETVNAEVIVTEWEGGTIAPDANLPVVIDFNADWCPPCRMFRPVFEKAAAANRDRALFVSVNVDSNPDAARQFNVTSIPQVSVLRPDGTVTTTSGYMDTSDFNAFLAGALSK